MLDLLISRLGLSVPGAGLFGYITFRAMGAMATAMVIGLVAGPTVIRRLAAVNARQAIRAEGPLSHQAKVGTPTMGGLLLIAAVTLATLLWAGTHSPYPWVALAVFCAMGAVGLLDDYLKVARRHSQGLIARYKFTGQVLIGAGMAAFLLAWGPDVPPATNLPFIARMSLVIPPVLFVPWTIFVVTGTSNAVNLTDGLDGLAAGLAAIAAAVLTVYAYILGRVDMAAYLGFLYLPGAGELAVFCAALTGASLAFLWYNAPPADVFMGDTGSLALGGALAAVAVLLKVEFLLVILGGVFVVETMSVAIQVGVFKGTRARTGVGRRVFLMAPLHHHFEEAGWPETRIVVRFWLIGILFALIALALLKVR